MTSTLPWPVRPVTTVTVSAVWSIAAPTTSTVPVVSVTLVTAEEGIVSTSAACASVSVTSAHEPGRRVWSGSSVMTVVS